MFLKAVELDPNYARAYAGIAECECAIRDWHEKEFPLESILDMSARALALDPNLAEAHASRGLALNHDGQTEEASREFLQALALDPSLYRRIYIMAVSSSRRVDSGKRSDSSSARRKSGRTITFRRSI